MWQTSTNNTISVIDTATNTVIATVNVGTDPSGVAVTPDGKKVYVANQDSNNVSVIDTATNTVTASIPVGNGPSGVAIQNIKTRGTDVQDTTPKTPCGFNSLLFVMFVLYFWKKST